MLNYFKYMHVVKTSMSIVKDRDTMKRKTDQRERESDLAGNESTRAQANLETKFPDFP